MQYTGQAGHLLGKLCVVGTGQFIVECSDLSAATEHNIYSKDLLIYFHMHKMY